MDIRSGEYGGRNADAEAGKIIIEEEIRFFLEGCAFDGVLGQLGHGAHLFVLLI
jgi:hypothetical protein